VPADNDLARWCRDLRFQARMHRDQMCRMEPAEREELAVYRNSCQLHAQLQGTGATDRAPSRGAAPSHAELTEELRRLQRALAGKAEETPPPSPERRVDPRLSHRMQVTASALKDSMLQDEATLRLSVLHSPSRMPRDVFMSEEPEVVCELGPIARQLEIPMEDVLLARSVFNQFNQDGSGSLQVAAFEAAALELLRVQGWPEGTIAEHLREVGAQLRDLASGSSLDLQGFLKWYCRGLNEGLRFTDGQRLAELASQHGVSEDYVCDLKRCFDTCSADRPGYIGLGEFAQLLQRALRVPPHLEFPLSRARLFWTELCGGSSQRIRFEAFLRWWVRYFQEDMLGGEAPFEAFYGQVRRIGREHLDPRLPPTLAHVA